MFNTYVINLDRSKKRLGSFHKNFENTDIYKSITRFQAIDGKNISENLLKSKTNFLARNFIPDSTIGCGISHIELASYVYENDKNDFALILEDDVFPNQLKLKDKIIEIAKDPIYKDWDIIRLFCQGFYPKGVKYDTFTSKFLSGSCAAYLISKTGQKKMADKMVKYHIDTQQNFSTNINLYRQNKYNLFNVDVRELGSDQVHFDNEGHLTNASIGGVTMGYAMNFPVAKIPILNWKIAVWHVIAIILIIFLLIFIKIIKML